MAFDSIWSVVNFGLNNDIHWETQPVIWLAFALPCNFTFAWIWDTPFWN